ncbi:MAG: hypothetical protein HQL73_03245 [Magnetococcales bacterium]|nr:hypothetical protein [Magnetococcales bacterium]
MSTFPDRRLRRMTTPALALSAVATLAITLIAPTSEAQAYCCATYFPAASYVYPVSYAYTPVVYSAPLTWTTYSYTYAYPYYTTPVYYSWPGVTLGCVGLAC